MSQRSSSSSSSSNNKKNKDIARSGKPKRAIDLVDEDFISSLKSNPAYEGIEIDRELGKMDAWLSLKRNRAKKRSQGRFLNWLNKAEVPMRLPDSPPTDEIDRRLYEIKKAREKRDEHS
jgi:hypothetical protein